MVQPMIRAANLLFALTFAATTASAGETRCWFENGAVVAPAGFGDVTGDFIIDLSQAGSQIHETSARMRGYTGNSMIATLRVGGARIAGFAAGVSDLDARTSAFTTNISGVLGADAFRGFVFELDFAPCRLRLSRGAKGNVAGGSSIRLRTFGGRPAMPAAISDGKTSRSGWFLIDTASRGSLIANADFSRPPRDPAASAPARLRALSLAGVLFEQTPAGLMTQNDTRIDGAIGAAVLAHFRLRLDQTRGWLTLAPVLRRSVGQDQ